MWKCGYLKSTIYAFQTEKKSCILLIIYFFFISEYNSWHLLYSTHCSLEPYGERDLLQTLEHFFLSTFLRWGDNHIQTIAFFFVVLHKVSVVV